MPVLAVNRGYGLFKSEPRVSPPRPRGDGVMLTTCPKCAHTYTPQHQHQHLATAAAATGAATTNLSPPLPAQCCQAKPMATVQPRYVNQPPAAQRTYVNQMPAEPTTKPTSKPAMDQCVVKATQNGGGISVSLHLPPCGSTTVSITASSHTTTPNLTVTAFTNPDVSHRVLAGMAGGGIISGNNVLLQDDMGKPQPSPSVPLSFVLPTPPSSLNLPWQWTQSWVPPLQSEIDLTRLASTMDALRMSGWYYEGLSWQDSSDLLRDTQPGTFLVRDSSDPRFLFSLSVQTERGPTSVRLHYVCGQFRLDAEQKLAPLMPMFDCVVKLVEHYIQATRDSGFTKGTRAKDEVWVDARGHMYSHILLTCPLYRSSVLPSLQHLARLVINDQIKKRSSQGVGHLPLPEALKQYLKEYPHAH